MGNKSYTYVVYDENGVAGTLQNVVSEFQYSQIINTVGSQLNIVLQEKFADLGANTQADFLVDELGNNVADDNGSKLITDVEYGFDNAPIALGNRVVVTEKSDTYPSGKQVFEGYITTWESDVMNETTRIEVLSAGYDLTQTVIGGVDTINVEQPEYDGEVVVNLSQAYGQTFQVVADATISSIDVYARVDDTNSFQPSFFTMYLLKGTPSNQQEILKFASKIIYNRTTERIRFSFATPAEITAGTDYCIILAFNILGADMYVQYNSTDVYADGELYLFNGVSWATATGDMRFNVNAVSDELALAISGADAGSAIDLAMFSYQNKGGHLSYEVEQAGVLLYYTFNIATTKEIIDKALAVSPAGYYYYTDVANSVFYFKSSGITYDHLFTVGKDIESLKIERTIDELINTVYFVGGDSGSGSNLVVTDSKVGSIEKYGTWTNIRSDLRVTDIEYANAYINTLLSNDSDAKFRVQMTVLSDTYDISTIEIGDMVKIANTNSFLDDVLLQVVEKTVSPYEIALQLGSVPPRTTNTINILSQQIEQIEKQNNPTEST